MVAHWSDKYLGKSFENCSQFVEVVLREIFGRNFSFLEGTSDEKENSNRIQKELFKFCLVEERQVFSEGDLVLMSLTERGCHIGLYIEMNNESYVLHYMPNQGLFRHKLRHIKLVGYYIEGIYSWI
jgi:hypothetical protein